MTNKKEKTDYYGLTRKDIYKLIKELPKNQRPYKWYKKTKAELVKILENNNEYFKNIMNNG